MDVTSAWRSAFESWPADLPRSGMVVTSGQESIPFVDFLISDTFVIVERDKPDSQGARKLIIALAAIVAVKLPTTEDLSKLQPFTAKKEEPDDGFGVPAGLASRAAAAVRRTGAIPRGSF